MINIKTTHLNRCKNFKSSPVYRIGLQASLALSNMAPTLTYPSYSCGPHGVCVYKSAYALTSIDDIGAASFDSGCEPFSLCRQFRERSVPSVEK